MCYASFQVSTGPNEDCWKNLREVKPLALRGIHIDWTACAEPNLADADCSLTNALLEA